METLVVRELHVKAHAPNARTMDVVASTEAVDSYGEIVEQKWDLKRYERNPIVLYAHNSRELPIGKARDVAVVEGQLQATIEFASAEANPLAEQVWKLVQEGVLKAVSVGFFPRDVRVEKRDGKEVYVLSNNELVEISVVPIPANPEALAKALLLEREARETNNPPKETKMKEQKQEQQAQQGTEREAGEHREPAEELAVVKELRESQAKLVTLEAENKTLRERVESFERSALLEEGIRSGKLTASDRDSSTERGKKFAAMPLAELRSHLELALPSQLLKETGPTAPATPPDEELTAEEKRLAEKYGTPLEALRAAKKAAKAANAEAR